MVIHVRGKGNPAGLCSAPHGAGRRFSRTEARRCFTADDLAARMEGIEYRHGAQWVGEQSNSNRAAAHRSTSSPKIY